MFFSSSSGVVPHWEGESRARVPLIGSGQRCDPEGGTEIGRTERWKKKKRERNGSEKKEIVPKSGATPSSAGRFRSFLLT